MSYKYIIYIYIAIVLNNKSMYMYMSYMLLYISIHIFLLWHLSPNCNVSSFQTKKCSLDRGSSSSIHKKYPNQNLRRHLGHLWFQGKPEKLISNGRDHEKHNASIESFRELLNSLGKIWCFQNEASARIFGKSNEEWWWLLASKFNAPIPRPQSDNPN